MVEAAFWPFTSVHTGMITVVMEASASAWLANRRLFWSPKRSRHLRGFSPW